MAEIKFYIQKVRFIVVFFLIPTVAFSQEQTHMYDLTCNYQHNPVNINDPHPTLGWKTKSSMRNYLQTAYQVIVASDSVKLSKNNGDRWNSGKIYSDQSINITYKGDSLRSNQDCWWKVRTWGNHHDSSKWSDPGHWRVSFINENDWHGKWIASDIELNDLQKRLKALPDFTMETEDSNWVFEEKLRKVPKEEENAPAVYLRKEFEVTKKIKSIYATITGLGFYELFINGERVSDEYLNPAFSDYQKRVYYNTYDVMDYVHNGKNAVGVILGNGWYNLIIPHALRYQTADYIDPPKVKMEIIINYTDGSQESVVTDTTWKFTTEGPIRFNCILGGETYDNRKLLGTWDKVGYDESQWKIAKICQAPEGRMDAQEVYPVRKTGEHPARNIYYKGDTLVVDFGMELTGWARVKLRGKRGQEIRVAYPGDQMHTLGRYQTCKYILNGDSTGEFESRFSYNGFNKLWINGLDYKPTLSDFTAISVNTDMPFTGTFECSNDTLNRLQNIIIQSIRNYIVHLPNDPTREKAAWTQDIENAFDAIAYNFDCYSLYRKWQYDFLDIQHENGYVPPVVPGRFDGPTINGPWWGGMIIYQPWKIYQYYADKRILEASFPSMKKYLWYLLSLTDNYVLSWGLGDWLEPGTVRPVKTPIPLTSTLALYFYSQILANTAEILGKQDEKDIYNLLSQKIRQVYNHTFLNPVTGEYAKGSQASQLMSLCLGAVPKKDEERVKAALLNQIWADSMHLSTGFVSTPMLLQGLSDLGYPKIAYSIATQKTYPSWIDMVFNHGHNVLNEHWDGGAVQMPALGGGLGAWFYSSLAGIKPDKSAPGFKQIVIDPSYYTSLTWVKASYETLYGSVKVRWEKYKTYVNLVLQIPENTQAKVYLPEADTTKITENGRLVSALSDIRFEKKYKEKLIILLGSGAYQFRIPFSK